MTKDERAGLRIARKVMRTVLMNVNSRQDMDTIAESYVENTKQMRSARYHIRSYCRCLAGYLKRLP